MHEIFKRQWQLNIHTLANIGKDFEKTIADPEQKVIWIENYRKALSAELAELIREVEEYGIGTRNGRIEIIDIMHFLVSLSHIVDVKPEEIPSFSITENGGFVRILRHSDFSWPRCAPEQPQVEMVGQGRGVQTGESQGRRP